MEFGQAARLHERARGESSCTKRPPPQPSPFQGEGVHRLRRAICDRPAGREQADLSFPAQPFDDSTRLDRVPFEMRGI